MIEQEIDSLAPGRDFSRRDFVRTSVGSGFAAAEVAAGGKAVDLLFDHHGSCSTCGWHEGAILGTAAQPCRAHRAFSAPCPS